MADTDLFVGLPWMFDVQLLGNLHCFFGGVQPLLFPDAYHPGAAVACHDIPLLAVAQSVIFAVVLDAGMRQALPRDDTEWISWRGL